MYNKLIKKHYLYKLFTLSLPKKNRSNSVCFFLCSYFIKNTPYGNIKVFIQEIYRVLGLWLNTSSKKNILFICMSKIFFINFISLNKKQIDYINYNDSLFFCKNKISFVVLYNVNVNNKHVSLFKEKKIPSIGFIDFHGQPNLSDYTLLLEAKSFSSIFLFHFILKKIILIC